MIGVVEITLDGGTDAVNQLLASRHGPRMDLGTAPLLRVYVAAEPGTDRWLALLRIHHLLEDHTAQDIVMAEVAAFMRGEGSGLAEPVAFRGFVAQARLGTDPAEHERFFTALLGDVSEPTIPFGLADVHGDGTAAAQARLVVDDGLSGRVRDRARALGVSPATVFHVVWARVLAAAAGRDDVVFGTVLFGRLHAGPGADRVPGPFMNTLPVRTAG